MTMVMNKLSDSTGIGAVYADRFARRSHDLVLVARNVESMTTLTKRLRSETSVNADVARLSAIDPLPDESSWSNQ